MKKQLKISLLSAAILLASTASFADGTSYKGGNYKGEMMAPCPAPTGLKDGFYLGGEVGYDSYRTRENLSTTIGGTAITSNPATNPTGFVGGLFAGYGQYVNESMYLGAEAFINDSGASTTHNVNTYSSKVSANMGYGISLLPGYRINNDSLFYIRLGYNWARLKIQESDSAAATSGSKTNTSGGFNYGLGMESMLYQNWSLRGEFTHTNYNSFTSNVYGTKVSPSDNQYLLGLIYHFA